MASEQLDRVLPVRQDKLRGGVLEAGHPPPLRTSPNCRSVWGAEPPAIRVVGMLGLQTDGAALLPILPALE